MTIAAVKTDLPLWTDS